MKKLITLTLFVLLCYLGIAQTTATCDFNNFTVGPLNGQNNWVAKAHSAGGGVMTIDYLGGDGYTTADETLGLFFSNANTNYGQVATRKSTDDFYFDFSTGGTIQIELDVHRNWWGVCFGVGYDADNDGVVLPPMNYETTYPNPNINSNDGGIYFVSTAPDPRPQFINGIVLPNNTLAVDFDYDYTEWTRWRLLIDMEANNRQGSVALFADHGCVGSFEPVAEIQGVNAGLQWNSGTAADPTMWDGIFILNSSHAGFDNLTVTHIPAGVSSQFIDFTTIPDHLISDQPFQVSASCTSGLPITYQVVEGPATISGNTVTLSGTAGIVKIRATQAGNDEWQEAPSIVRSFEVVDPSQYTPTLTIRRPYNNTLVYMSGLDSLIMLASVDVEHSDVILVEDIQFSIGAANIACRSTGNNYYAATWLPESYGTHNAVLSVTLSGNNTYTLSNTFEIVSNVDEYEVMTFDGSYQVSPNSQVISGEFVFPTHVGSVNHILAELQSNCASGGCDTYDRTARLKAKNIHGDWIEIFKYITSFGVPCSDTANVSDFASIFQGLVELEYEVVCWNGGGYLPEISFTFSPGVPAFKYSDVVEVWNSRYDFGDYANLQPVPQTQWTFNPNVLKAALKVSTTGHNWSSNTSPNYGVNTGNAAEFYEATHNIKVDGVTTFEQHLWETCNPNPAACSPQNGTWVFNRAGWCPGSMAHVWNHDLTSFISNGNINLDYQFDPNYVDLCHPNHPDCVDGLNGCPNCAAPDNPLLDVSVKMISFANNPYLEMGQMQQTGNNEGLVTFNQYQVAVFPNPSKGVFSLESKFQAYDNQSLRVEIFNVASAQLIRQFNWDGTQTLIDLSTFAKGTYIIKVIGNEGVEVRKVLIY